MEIINYDFDELLFWLKIISAVISFMLGGLAVYFIIKFRELVGLKLKGMKASLRVTEVSSGGGVSKSRWDEIVNHLNSGSEAEWKLAVIEADKLVDDVLRTSGFGGDSMGERLMSIDRTRLASLEGLWDAHKIRNKLVHDVGYFLRHAEARRAIQLFERALHELGAI